MAKSHEITVTLIGHERLPNSRNGNPRYDIVTSEGKFRTQTDGAVGFIVDNFTRGLGDPDSKDPQVILSLTPAGRVWDIHYA